MLPLPLNICIRATLGRVSGIFIGFGNAGLDEFTEELLDVSFLEMRMDDESHVEVRSSPMIFSAGREQYEDIYDSLAAGLTICI